jgi:hypothetical protein
VVVLPGQELTATIIAELAGAVFALDERLKTLGARLSRTSPSIPRRRSSDQCPASGRSWGASLLVGAGRPSRLSQCWPLAAAAGLVPVPNDSGRRTGNLHRPPRYSRLL